MIAKAVITKPLSWNILRILGLFIFILALLMLITNFIFVKGSFEVMEVNLDCTNYASAKSSLARIFNTTEDDLLLYLESFGEFESSQSDDLYRYLFKVNGLPMDKYNVTWFHFSHVEDVNSFYRNGIFTTGKARNILHPRLTKLSEGLDRRGSNPFAESTRDKISLPETDEGPHAFLIRDAALATITNKGNTFPELVYDIAGDLVGENYTILVDRFFEISIPCVVSFLSDPKCDELQHALAYVKMVYDGEDELVAARLTNIYFDSKGVDISPDRVQKVDTVGSI